MLTAWLTRRLIAWGERRRPDFTIGEPGRPYLERHFVIPRNPVFNIYLHRILRSDDDRALHDHPWVNCSIVLAGGYFEVMPDPVHGTRQVWRGPGTVVWRRPTALHRLVTGPTGPCWTLFLTGPRVRSWGFACPQGWVDWKQFTRPGDTGTVGRGCE